MFVKHIIQGVQRRRVLVVIFSCVFLNVIFCFVVVMSDLVQDVETTETNLHCRSCYYRYTHAEESWKDPW